MGPTTRSRGNNAVSKEENTKSSNTDNETPVKRGRSRGRSRGSAGSSFSPKLKSTVPEEVNSDSKDIDSLTATNIETETPNINSEKLLEGKIETTVDMTLQKAENESTSVDETSNIKSEKLLECKIESNVDMPLQKAENKSTSVEETSNIKSEKLLESKIETPVDVDMPLQKTENESTSVESIEKMECEAPVHTDCQPNSISPKKVKLDESSCFEDHTGGIVEVSTGQREDVVKEDTDIEREENLQNKIVTENKFPGSDLKSEVHNNEETETSKSKQSNESVGRTKKDYSSETPDSANNIDKNNIEENDAIELTQKVSKNADESNENLEKKNDQSNLNLITAPLVNSDLEIQNSLEIIDNKADASDSECITQEGKTDGTIIGPVLPSKECLPQSDNVSIQVDDDDAMATSVITNTEGVEKVDSELEVKAKEKNVSKIEYISEYSSEGRKKLPNKKSSEESKAISKSAEEPTIVISPLLKSANVDAEQLEKETKQYYKEVSTEIETPVTEAQKTVKEKPKCLTPAEIAKIAKSYPTSSENAEASAEVQASWATLHQYWTHVQENPYDFDGWTYLMNHVETMDNIEAARSAFEGFLPLYPYCFAYWKKLSDLEFKFSDLEQCLGVLYNGTKSVPFCSDLWIPLLNQFLEYAKKENMSEESIRGIFEFSLENVGLAWQSSAIWQLYLDYEVGKGDLVRVLDIYRRLVSVPNKLFNKHWDHVLSLIRDHHPRNYLSVNEYFKLKKHVSESMNVKFVPPPMVPPKHLLKVTQPEDPIQTAMKEKIVATLIPEHESNESEADKRWKFEDKIKRPYFHVKPLEKKQLKTWRDYLEFEIQQGDPVRIVTLFERCLIPCAMYEEFWCKYAAFIETHVLNVINGKYSCTEYKASQFRPKPTSDETADNDDSPFDFWESPETKPARVSREIKFEVMFLLNRLGQGIGLSGKVLCSPSLTPMSILQGLTWEDVRQIYRRAAWIHCPSKPKLLMQWAEFEESQGNVQTARELINNVINKNPLYLSARLQLIELERRNEQYDRVEELYAQTFSTFKDSRIKSCIAIKYARFLFKIKEEVEKALMILRKAMKKDKANVHLYHHVFDICYQRRPVDVHGVLAAVMLALSSKEMPLEEKNWFCIKRLDFLREHGTISQYKHSKAEADEIGLKYEAEKMEKAKKQAAEDEAAKIKESPSKEAEHQTTATDKATEEQKKKGDEEGKTELDGMKEKRKRSESPRRKSRKKERREKGEIREHKSSKRSRKSPEKHRTHKRKSKEPESDNEVLYASDGTLLYDPQSENMRFDEPPPQTTQNMNVQGPPNQQGYNNQPHLGPEFPQQGMPRFPHPPTMETKDYHSVPPDWKQEQTVSSNYGYGSSHPITKENQNALYNQYYDMVGHRFTAPQGKDAGPPPSQYAANSIQEAIAVNAAAASVAGIAGRDPNSYLPPPPVPQGILGDSLFNQGRLPPPFPMGQLNPPPLLNVPPPNIPFQDNPRKIRPPFHKRRHNLPRDLEQRKPLIETLPVKEDLLAPMRRPMESMGLLKKPRSFSMDTDSSSYKDDAPNRNNVVAMMRDRKNSLEMSPVTNTPPPLMDIPINGDSIIPKPALLGLPPLIRNAPQFTPRNVPDWLIKEGGELKLSSSPKGESVLRFWPRYMNEHGHKTLFQSLRKSVKWNQRRFLSPEEKWVSLPKLVSWVGPCDYEKDGMVLSANTSWPPEIVDLLHRLIHFSNSSFNSCFLSLYTNGYAYHPWNTERHQALEKTPTIATISLGCTRTLEMKRKDGPEYIRLPLFPGSVLILEGAVQDDWLCQIPKEPEATGERISVSFRTMLMIKGLTV